MTLRKTILHPDLHEKFMAFVSQVFQVSGTLLAGAVEFKNLAEVSLSGAEARMVLELINGLGKEEWQADKLVRKLSIAIYKLENRVRHIDIIFYEKMRLKLAHIANESENTRGFLRAMLRKYKRRPATTLIVSFI